MKTTENGMYLEPLFNYACEHDGEFDRLAFHLILAKQTGVITDIITELENDFGYKVIMKRCPWAGFEIEPALAILLAATAKSPGALIMFAHAIYHFANRVDGELVTVEQFCANFSKGLPSDATLSVAWDAQKIPQGYGRLSFTNGLDWLGLFCASAAQPFTIGNI